MSSLQVLPCRQMVTGVLPKGFIQAPLTALGLISEDVRMSKQYPRMLTIACPVTDISAPESSNTITGTVLEEVVICIVIVCAGSALSPV